MPQRDTSELVGGEIAPLEGVRLATDRDRRSDGDPERLAVLSAMQREGRDVLVNYDLSHPEQIRRAKVHVSDDYENLLRKDPTEHLYFHPSGEFEQRIMFVHLGRFAEEHEVLVEMHKRNVRPTISPETLAYIAAHPDVQRQFPLVGLGSLWEEDEHGYQYVLYCYEEGGTRTVDPQCLRGAFCPPCRFLVVRNS